MGFPVSTEVNQPFPAEYIKPSAHPRARFKGFAYAIANIRGKVLPVSKKNAKRLNR